MMTAMVTSTTPEPELPFKVDFYKEISMLERELVVKALWHTGGKQKAAAQLLSITFRQIRYLIEKHQLQDNTIVKAKWAQPK